MYEGYFYDFTKEEQEDFERNEADAKRKSEQITRVAERIKEQTTPWNRNF
jgi:FtsZ-binding cell division protein ZapB